MVGCVNLGACAVDLGFTRVRPEAPIVEHQHVTRIAIDAQDFVAVGHGRHCRAVEHHGGGVAATQVNQLHIGDACGAVGVGEVVAVATHLQGVKTSTTVDRGIGCFGQQAHIRDILVVVAVAESDIPQQGVIAIATEQGVLFDAPRQGVMACAADQGVKA